MHHPHAAAAQQKANKLSKLRKHNDDEASVGGESTPNSSLSSSSSLSADNSFPQSAEEFEAAVKISLPPQAASDSKKADNSSFNARANRRLSTMIQGLFARPVFAGSPNSPSSQDEKSYQERLEEKKRSKTLSDQEYAALRTKHIGANDDSVLASKREQQMAASPMHMKRLDLSSVYSNSADSGPRDDSPENGNNSPSIDLNPLLVQGSATFMTLQSSTRLSNNMDNQRKGSITARYGKRSQSIVQRDVSTMHKTTMKYLQEQYTKKNSEFIVACERKRLKETATFSPQLIMKGSDLNPKYCQNDVYFPKRHNSIFVKP